MKLYNPCKIENKAKYIHKRLKKPSIFIKKSFRTIPIGKHGKKLIIGKLKGHKKTTSQSLLIPKKEIIKNPIQRNNILLNVGNVKELTFTGINPKTSNICKLKIKNDNKQRFMFLTGDLKHIIIYPLYFKYKFKRPDNVKDFIDIKINKDVAIKNYKKFKGFLPINTLIGNIKFDKNHIIGFISKGDYIIYNSNKFDKIPKDYIHKFTNVHNVYINDKNDCLILHYVKINNRGIID